MTDLELQLNAANREDRLAALRALAQTPPGERLPGNVNNHIHTTYSFSPYSPSMALWRARQSGLVTAGIMDHDSIAGAPEFLEAGCILGMAVTCGVECRLDFSGTPFAARRINNPDQSGVAYASLHGVPSRAFGAVREFFEPYRRERNRRNREMVRNIDGILSPFGMGLDFDADVLPLSLWSEGGSVTERHVVMGLCRALVARLGRGPALLSFVERDLKAEVPAKARALLLDPENPYYEYDLLGVFKGHFVQRFYVDAAAELPAPAGLADLARRTGSILAYPYLGDVVDSVTGDKRAQKFEDEYLDELMDYLKSAGFMAVTYAPTRNTREQLRRLRALCAERGLFEVSGEDINTPRQSFLCEAMREPEFFNLVDSTWALIAHERLSDADPSAGLFSPETAARYPDMEQRVAVFAQMGRLGQPLAPLHEGDVTK